MVANQKRFRSVLALGACFLLSIMLIFLLYLSNSTFRHCDVRNAVVGGDNIEYAIDRVQNNGRILTITAWVVQEGDVQSYYNWVSGYGRGVYINRQILLEDPNGIYYQINTAEADRPDLTKKINDGINYKKCGILGTAESRKLKRGVSYKVALLLKSPGGKKTLVPTDTVIHG